jgi:tripartite ATP-independent transporter DctM subunit
VSSLVDFDLNVLLVLLMFASFIALLLAGYPVAFVLAGVGLLFAALGEVLNAAAVDVDADLSTIGLLIERLYGTMSSYSLVPLPLFVFMGHMLDRSGVAVTLLRSMQTALGRVPGGLALAVMAIGVVLAASTGIIGASVALLGTLALPAMLDDRYQTEFAVGTVASAGCLGILIPPSIMLVLMADQMRLSVGDLFLGAVIPGLVLAALYFLYIVLFAALRPDLAPPVPEDRRPEVAPLRLAAELARALTPPVSLIVAVLGSIFFGIASPSEAAGVGAAGATLLAFSNRSLDLRTLREVARRTARTTSFIFAILVGASCFSVVLRGLGGDEVIESGLLPRLDRDHADRAPARLPDHARARDRAGLVHADDGGLSPDLVPHAPRRSRALLPPGRRAPQRPALPPVPGGGALRAAPAPGDRHPVPVARAGHLAARADVWVFALSGRTHHRRAGESPSVGPMWTPLWPACYG